MVTAVHDDIDASIYLSYIKNLDFKKKKKKKEKRQQRQNPTKLLFSCKLDWKLLKSL